MDAHFKGISDYYSLSLILLGNFFSANAGTVARAGRSDDDSSQSEANRVDEVRSIVAHQDCGENIPGAFMQ